MDVQKVFFELIKISIIVVTCLMLTVVGILICVLIW